MKILVTGANGFLGRHVVSRLCAATDFGGAAVEAIVLSDLRVDAPPNDPRVQLINGDISDPGVLASMAAAEADIVFHLAAIVSGRAEEDFGLGRRVNLTATLELLDRLSSRSKPPTLVYASTIAVLGPLGNEPVHDDTPATPSLSYGAHKLAVEIVLSDYCRRGILKGGAVRLPGIVLRPPTPNGARSAFAGDLIRAMCRDEPYCCPVGPQSTLWLMSLECCLDNLLHVPFAFEAGRRCIWTLPAVRASIADIIDVMAARLGPQVRDLVTFAPDPDIERDFGRFPRLLAHGALAAGFRDDGGLVELIERAIAS